MSTVVIKSIDENEVRRRMDEHAADLLAIHDEIEEIVVFGSFAKDTYAPGSDLDVFIVLSRSDLSVRDRIPRFLPRTFPVGIDLFPYTHEEIEALRPSSLLDEVATSNWRYRRD